MESEDPNEQELGRIEGKLLLTLGGGAVLVVLLFLLGRFALTSMFSESSATPGVEPVPADGALGVLVFAIVMPGSGRPPIDVDPGGGLTGLRGVLQRLRAARAGWGHVGAIGTPPMAPSASREEAARLVTAFRERLGAPAGAPSGTWAVVVAVRAPRDFSAVMPSDAAGFESALAPLYELDGEVAFEASWIRSSAGAELAERMPSMIPA